MQGQLYPRLVTKGPETRVCAAMPPWGSTSPSLNNLPERQESREMDVASECVTALTLDVLQHNLMRSYPNGISCCD